MWSFLYILLLFILLTPSFIFKIKPSIKIYMIHALLFSFLFYLTFDLVKGKYIEGNGYSIEIEGASTVVEFLKQILGRNQQPIQIDVNNHLATIDDPDVSHLPDISE